MFKLFQKQSSHDAADTGNALAQAEQTLVAESLLRASAALIGAAAPIDAARAFCGQLVRTTPNICLAWVWFGDPRSAVIEPQVVVGPPSVANAVFSVEAEFFGDPVASGAAWTTRLLEVSAATMYAPWRTAAARFGARSIVVVPLGGDGNEQGLMAVYSTQPRYFTTVGIGLFEIVGQLLCKVVRSVPEAAAPEPATAGLDALTGLPLKTDARRALDGAWAQSCEHETRGLLALVALDRFRVLNERFGRDYGDQVLQQVTTALMGCVRSTDLVARWSGDQFLLWLPGVASWMAGGTAEKLRSAIASITLPAVVGDAYVPRLTASVGATPAMSVESLVTVLDRVDRALTRAKQNGRDCATVARPGA